MPRRTRPPASSGWASVSDEEALLAAVRADPGDDTPRLVYADWLEEHARSDADTARAEFIRVQCELARLPDDDERCSELQARELRLFSRHGADWHRDIRAHVEFRRGFLEVWNYAYPELFGGGGRDLFDRHPVREVSLYLQDIPNPPLWSEALAASPHAARIETLRVTGGSEKFPFPEFLAILSSPHLTGLTDLDASGGYGQYGDSGLFELLGAAGTRPRGGHWGRRRGAPIRAGEGLLPSLRNLRKLSLHSFGVTDRGLRLLISSPLADTLTHLDLSAGFEGPRLTADGVRALVESRLWPRLEALNLGGLYAGEDPTAARLLFEALPRSNLRVLGLSHYAFYYGTNTAGLVRAMVSAPSWGRLEALSLTSNAFRPRDLRTLFRCPHLAGLRRLHLGGRVSGVGVRAMAECPYLAGLTTLILSHSECNDDGMAALAASPHLRRLVHLNVNWCPVGDAGVAAFVRSPNAARLRLLEIPGVGDDALKAIAESEHLGRLTVVRFGGWTGPAKFTPVTDAGALAVARSTSLPNLAVLDRHWPEAAAAGLRALAHCDRLAYAGRPFPGNDPGLRAAFSRFGDLPYDLAVPRGLRPLFPWSSATLT